MINIRTQIDVKNIQKELSELSEELKVKAVKAGVAKVSTSGVKLMKDLSPVKTGELKKSIRRKQLSITARARLQIRPEQVAVIVGPNYNGMGRIANVLEGGAKGHKIAPRKESRVQGVLRAQGMRGKKRMVLSNRKDFFSLKPVYHPGLTARRFIQRTDDANKSKAELLFYTGVRNYLKRINK